MKDWHDWKNNGQMGLGLGSEQAHQANTTIEFSGTAIKKDSIFATFSTL